MVQSENDRRDAPAIDREGRARSAWVRLVLVAVVPLVAYGGATLAGDPIPSPTQIGDLGYDTNGGVVYDAAGGPTAPIADAIVQYTQISLVRSGQSGSVLTDRSGHYSFRLFLHDTDTIIVQVQANGFLPASARYGGLQLWYADRVDFGLVANPPPSPTPTPTQFPCPIPTTPPLWVDPVTSPTNELSQIVTVLTDSADWVEVITESGTFVASGNFHYPNPASVTITLLPNTVHHLDIRAHIRTNPGAGCPADDYVLRTTVDRLGAPLIIVQGSPAPTVPATASTRTPTPVVCPQATPELLQVDPLISPTDQLSQVVMVRMGHLDRVEIHTESGTFTTIGNFDLAPAPVPVTLFPNTTHHLEVVAHVRAVLDPFGCVYGNYSLNTSHDRLGAPLIIVQQPTLGTVTPGPSPTPTPTIDDSLLECLPDLSLMPSAGRPGDLVHASGRCYFIHSGQAGSIYFDSTLVGTVRGDTIGNYDLAFTVPSEAIPGFHQVRLVNTIGMQHQSAIFEVTINIPATSTATPTLTAVPSASPTRGSGGGGCAVAPDGVAEPHAGIILLLALAARLAARRCAVTWRSARI